jgi:hypothetical protein
MIFEKHTHVSKMNSCAIFLTPLHYTLIPILNHIFMNSLLALFCEMTIIPSGDDFLENMSEFEKRYFKVVFTIFLSFLQVVDVVELLSFLREVDTVFLKEYFQVLILNYFMVLPSGSSRYRLLSLHGRLTL